MPRFIHPVHARGVCSSLILPPSVPLTNAAITRYALAGRYGTEAQRIKQERLKSKKKSVRKPSQPTLKDISHLL